MPSDVTGPAIIEYVRYDLPLPAGRLRGRLRPRRRHPDRVPHCLGWELRRSVEEPGHYVVRIEWDSLAGHVHGFRESAPFRIFFGELSVFAGFRQEMEHYELVRDQLSAAESR